jgi:hypothetical protein
LSLRRSDVRPQVLVVDDEVLIEVGEKSLARPSRVS